jgi:hypothetical protein
MYRVVEELPLPAETDFAAPQSQFDDPEVDISAETLVQAHLLVAEMAPFLKGAEVQEAEVERLFKFVNILVCQVDTGDVGLLEGDGAGHFGIGRRVE